MLSFTTKNLFNTITSTDNWWVGFCEAGAARTMKSRHKSGTLSAESYEKLFTHFGYKKELVWTKN